MRANNSLPDSVGLSSTGFPFFLLFVLLNYPYLFVCRLPNSSTWLFTQKHLHTWCYGVHGVYEVMINESGLFLGFTGSPLF
jgi:hypothetical protein